MEHYWCKRAITTWCCAWVDLASSICEILCLGFVLTGWRLKAAKFFAWRWYR